MSDQPPRIPDLAELPLLSAALGDGREKFARRLAVIASHIPLGQIPNVRYEDVRAGLMDGLSDAWNAGVPATLKAIARPNGDYRAATIYGSDEETAWKLADHLGLSPYQGTKVAKTVAQRLGVALAKSYPAPIAEALRQGPELLAEIKVVTEAMEWIRARAVKRAAPGTAPPEPVLPPATLAAQKAVRERMKQVTGDLRERFAAAVAERTMREGELLIETCAELAPRIAEIARNVRRDIDAGRRPEYREPSDFRTLKVKALNLWRTGQHVAEYNPNTYETTRHPDAAERVAAHAERETERVFRLWTERNVQKLAPVVEAKGGVEIDVHWAQVSYSGVETRMAVRFPDGSRFNFSNGVETAVSTRDLEFLRFPARFHDVVLGDGSRLKAPSEARVREALVGPEEDPPAPAGPAR